MPFFGFIPSESLLNNIQTGIQKKNSSEPLYPLRDEVALQINDEILDAILLELVRRFPVSDKRETAEKLIIGGSSAMVFGANFSVGVNIFYKIVDHAAELFARFAEYETFIEEQHHSSKTVRGQ